MNAVKILKGAVVAAVAAATFAALPAQADVASWQKSVATTVAKKQTYPRSAIDNEIEGKAKVKVTIDRAGKISAFNVVQPTGQDVLDKEIPKLMERLSPLPTPPAELSDAQLTFVLPVSWTLN